MTATVTPATIRYDGTPNGGSVVTFGNGHHITVDGAGELVPDHTSSGLAQLVNSGHVAALNARSREVVKDAVNTIVELQAKVAAKSQLIGVDAEGNGGITQATLDGGITQATLDKVFEVANDLGYCSTFDEILAKVGLPGRPKTYQVPVDVTVRGQVEIVATSPEDAIAQAKVKAAEVYYGDHRLTAPAGTFGFNADRDTRKAPRSVTVTDDVYSVRQV